MEQTDISGFEISYHSAGHNLLGRMSVFSPGQTLEGKSLQHGLQHPRDQSTVTPLSAQNH